MGEGGSDPAFASSMSAAATAFFKEAKDSIMSVKMRATQPLTVSESGKGPLAPGDTFIVSKSHGDELLEKGLAQFVGSSSKRASASRNKAAAPLLNKSSVAAPMSPPTE